VAFEFLLELAGFDVGFHKVDPLGYFEIVLLDPLQVGFLLANVH